MQLLWEPLHCVEQDNLGDAVVNKGLCNEETDFLAMFFGDIFTNTFWIWNTGSHHQYPCDTKGGKERPDKGSVICDTSCSFIIIS